jgi:hypothetical protein
MKTDPNFNATSKRIQYIDTSLGYPIKTPIYYQLGEKNGQRCVRYYLNNEFASMRIINKKIKVKPFKLENHDGQNLYNARYQREECLVNIIKNLFEHFEYDIIIEPSLGILNPDIRISKNNVIYYIEVKAFHESYICGDPEISQCLKYYDHARQLDHAKIILITSGDLINPQDSFLNYPNQEPLEIVEKFYKDRITSRRQANTLDLLSARDIYRQAKKKFKKKYSKNLSTIKVEFLKNRHVAHFPECLTEQKNFEVLLIRASIFRKILYKEKMFKEMNKFDSLRKEPLERLIMNANLLKV